jgi:hypothetical protein
MEAPASRIICEKEAMRNVLPGYYQPTSEEFSEIWNHCTFVLDANVLLNVYRYRKGARDDLFKVLSRISSRLWIPHQAALEYQENRLSVIAEQATKFGEVQTILSGAMNKLTGDLSHLKLKKRHSAIEIDDLLDRVRNEISHFQTNLINIEREQPVLFYEDSLRDQLNELLSGKVGEPFSTDELSLVYREGVERYEKKRPPGYMDRAKAKPTEKEIPSYFFGGLEIRREFGDLILWKQIIKHAKANDVRHLLFVTDDEKEDWWWIADFKGEKTIGPRPELIHELLANTNVTHFYMYNTERLLQNATQYLGLSIEPTSIEQAKDIRALGQGPTEARETSSDIDRQQVLAAVARWLTSSAPASCTIMVEDMDKPGGLDLISYTAKGNFGYQVETVSTFEIGSIPIVTHRFGERWGLQHRFDLIDIKLVVVLYPVDARWPTAVALLNEQMLAGNLKGVLYGYLTEAEENGRPFFIFVPVSPQE